jgi:hypothetical protein
MWWALMAFRSRAFPHTQSMDKSGYDDKIRDGKIRFAAGGKVEMHLEQTRVHNDA